MRENTEGEYAQVGGVLYSGGAHEVAVQSAMFTRHGTERVIRFAFDLARRRNRKRLLTSVTKSNAQGFSMAFWDRVFADVAREYPDIRTESLLVDAACMDLVRRPETFDVIVASNLFGDILTDLSAAITGSLGLAPSANLNPDRTFPSMFEPVHGSAPDIAGRGIANPMAAMLAGGDDAGVPRTARGSQVAGGRRHRRAGGGQSRLERSRRRSGHRRSDGGGAGAPSMMAFVRPSFAARNFSSAPQSTVPTTLRIRCTVARN